jgi:hypothetical protein
MSAETPEREYVEWLRRVAPEIFEGSKSLLEVHYDIAHLTGASLTEFRSLVARADRRLQQLERFEYDAALRPGSLDARLGFAMAWLESVLGRFERRGRLETECAVPWAAHWICLELESAIRETDASKPGTLTLSVGAFEMTIRCRVGYEAKL